MQAINIITLSHSLSLSLCTVQSSLSFVSSAIHHSSIDEDAIVGELNIHTQREKKNQKKMNSRSSSVSSSSSSTTPTTTTTHGSITLERLEHEQFLHGSIRLPR
jgi:hypothetical protein